MADFKAWQHKYRTPVPNNKSSDNVISCPVSTLVYKGTAVVAVPYVACE